MHIFVCQYFTKIQNFPIFLLHPVFFRNTLLQLSTTNKIQKIPPRENNPIRISYFLDGCTQRIKIQVGTLKLQKTEVHTYLNFISENVHCTFRKEKVMVQRPHNVLL